MSPARALARISPAALIIAAVPVLAGGQSPLAAIPPLLPPAAAGPRIYICDQTNDAVYWSADLNLDGDANDPGELGVFFDTGSPDPSLHLATPRFVAVGPGGAVFVGDSAGDFVLRLLDTSLDGDANDVGEASRYYDNTAGGPTLSSINNMVFDAAGYLYISDSGASTSDRHVTRLRDDDGDGLCTAGAGEVQLIYSFTTTGGTVLERPAGLAIDADGTILLSEYQLDGIHRLADLTVDGDANDAGEQTPYFLSGAGVTTDFAESIAFAPPAAPLPATPSLYVNAGSVTDIVYRLHDDDGSGTIDNATEATPFWDANQADGIVPVTLFRIAVGVDGALYCAEAGSTASGVADRVVVLRDLDGDGDANETGEARIWVDGANSAGIVFGQVMAVAVDVTPAGPPPAPELSRGDCNADASTNIADAIFLLGYLFPGAGGSPAIACEDACDGNDDESMDIADAIATLAALFGSPTVPLPAPAACGPDPDGAGGALGCVSFPPCP